jgi:hypothetical protein
MTTAELHSLLEARSHDRQQLRKDMDLLNAKQCEILVKAPYFKEPRAASPDDFLVLSREEEGNTPDMSPDGILDRAFADLSKVSG